MHLADLFLLYWIGWAHYSENVCSMCSTYMQLFSIGGVFRQLITLYDWAKHKIAILASHLALCMRVSDQNEGCTILDMVNALWVYPHGCNYFLNYSVGFIVHTAQEL